MRPKIVIDHEVEDSLFGLFPGDMRTRTWEEFLDKLDLNESRNLTDLTSNSKIRFEVNFRIRLANTVYALKPELFQDGGRFNILEFPDKKIQILLNNYLERSKNSEMAKWALIGLLEEFIYNAFGVQVRFYYSEQKAEPLDNIDPKVPDLTPDIAAKFMYANKNYFIKYILKRGLNESDAEDIFQEVLLKVIQKLDSFSGKSKFKSWIIKIIINKVIDFKRRKKSNAHHVEIKDYHLPEDPTADSKLDFKRLLADISDALETFNPIHREILMLRAQGMSQKEIAKKLGIPIGTVGTRLMNARRYLNDFLEGR